MSDVIQLLPDAVANQIAAGEVIQRPASVVKELVENAIDAGATKIKVIIKDAGKSLIQVIDDGCGMSATDARLSFERHATSKIRKAEDLFTIKTMGFRGEALASIAAIAQVELKTRKEDEELGNHMIINGSNIEKQDFISCDKGSNFIVKNLFFNIPARRRFLKAESTEFRHILIQFQRIVMCYPDLSFSLSHNGSDVYNLPPGHHQKRILHLFGNSIGQNLIPVKTATSLVNLNGYIGKPENAKKKTQHQYFFVNQRFMRHPYFHKALMMAYENILPSESQPAYFIYFDIDPDKIDINVHPTKTEIKFEDSPAIFQIIRAAVKEALGKFNIVPSIDFDQEGSLDIPLLKKETSFNSPQVGINPNYNPFDNEEENNNSNFNVPSYKKETKQVDNWETLYQGLENKTFEQDVNQEEQLSIPQAKTQAQSSSSNVFVLKNKYIITPVKSGLMLINIRRAHERILYEQFIHGMENHQAVSQVSLFPTTLNLNHHDIELLSEIKDDLFKIGFDIQEFGKKSYVVNATPAAFENLDPSVLIEHFLEIFRGTEGDIKKDAHEKIALSMAQAAAIDYSASLTEIEMRTLIDSLFTCQIPNFTHGGKTIIHIMKMEEIEKLF
jgi:DNA mismatch repair protein MutL